MYEGWPLFKPSSYCDIHEEQLMNNRYALEYLPTPPHPPPPSPSPSYTWRFKGGAGREARRT
jgi:hypothetical protein